MGLRSPETVGSQRASCGHCRSLASSSAWRLETQRRKPPPEKGCSIIAQKVFVLCTKLRDGCAHRVGQATHSRCRIRNRRMPTEMLRESLLLHCLCATLRCSFCYRSANRFALPALLAP